MSDPKRIQRKRTKGWRMPENAVSITRPGKFGNPFTVEGCRNAGHVGTDEELRLRCISAFRVWIESKFWRVNWDGPESERRRQAILDAMPSIRGKDLACFCEEGKPCHGDVLIEIANREATQ